MSSKRKNKKLLNSDKIIKEGEIYSGKPHKKDFRNYFWTIDKHTGKEIQLQGITAIIKRLFFSSKWTDLAIAGNSSKKCTSSGKDRGNQVDAEMKDWVKLKTRHRLKRNVKPQTFQTFINGSHEYTRKLIKFLEMKNWEPIKAQSLVGCIKARVATPIDLVVKNDKGELILIEVKCGYNGVWKKTWTKKHMKVKAPGFTHLNANAYVYATIELVWGWMLYNTTHPVHKAKEAYVINVNDKKEVDAYKIETQLGLDLIKYLSAYMKHRVKQRYKREESRFDPYKQKKKKSNDDDDEDDF